MRFLVLAAILSAAPAMAAPGIVVAPMTSDGEHAVYPRLVAFPDPAIKARVNAVLAKAEAGDRKDQRDCLQQVKDAHQDKSFYDWDTSVAVTYVSQRFLSIDASSAYDCAGAHPDSIETPLTIDLRTGAAVDWTRMFKPGVLTVTDPKTYTSIKGKLAALYLARYIARNGKDDPEDCIGALRDEDFLEPALWLDAKKGGFLVSPQLAHVVKACGDEIALPPAVLAPLVTDQSLIDDLRVTLSAKR